MKYAKDILLLPTVKLFYRILKSGTFPDRWNVSLFYGKLKINIDTKVMIFSAGKIKKRKYLVQTE